MHNFFLHKNILIFRRFFNSANRFLYTTVVGEDGIVVVPEFISGEVELRLYRGSLVYQVTVEL